MYIIYGIPFELKLEVPNDTTAAAIEDGRKMMKDPSAPRYSSMDALKAALDVWNTTFSLPISLKLDAKYRDHDLTGNYKGTRECHIEPDWLLIYEICGDVLVLMLYRLGSHSELFKK